MLPREMHDSDASAEPDGSGQQRKRQKRQQPEPAAAGASAGEQPTDGGGGRGWGSGNSSSSGIRCSSTDSGEDDAKGAAGGAPAADALSQELHELEDQGTQQYRLTPEAQAANDAAVDAWDTIALASAAAANKADKAAAGHRCRKWWLQRPWAITHVALLVCAVEMLRQIGPINLHRRVWPAARRILRACTRARALASKYGDTGWWQDVQGEVEQLWDVYYVDTQLSRQAMGGVTPRHRAAFEFLRHIAVKHKGLRSDGRGHPYGYAPWARGQRAVIRAATIEMRRIKKRCVGWTPDVFYSTAVDQFGRERMYWYHKSPTAYRVISLQYFSQWLPYGERKPVQVEAAPPPAPAPPPPPPPSVDDDLVEEAVEFMEQQKAEAEEQWLQEMAQLWDEEPTSPSTIRGW